MQRMTFYVCAFLNYIKILILYDYLVLQCDLNGQNTHWVIEFVD